jgi:peptide/nickel transport system permease protein
LTNKRSLQGLASKELLVGTFLLLFLAGSFFLFPLIQEVDPFQTTLDIFAPPGGRYLLGTNDVGQDIFARLMTGGKNSLQVALGVGFCSTLLAAACGVSAGLAGGWFDKLLMRLVDVMLVIPNIIIIILIAAYLTPNITGEILIISLLTWLGGARIIRAQVLSLKERPHIYAARLFGAGEFYILRKHIWPELIPLLLTLFLQGARRAVLIEAGLGFLGLCDPNFISWGSMIGQALNFFYLDVWKWWLLPTAGVLALSLISLTLIGYSLEERYILSSERRKHGTANS